MVGMLAAIVIFNVTAFKTNKYLSTSQIAHLWSFTIAFQMAFDSFVDAKYHGYWYFTKAIDWKALPAHIMLLPPVNMMFINWFPFTGTFLQKLLYLICWEAFLLIYEGITILPEPWGYFHYGWWNLGISALVNPVLLIILILYYKKFIE